MIDFRVDVADAGRRIDALVASTTGIARARVQSSLRSGELRVNGEVVRPSYHVEPGDAVAGEVSDPAPGPPEAEDIPLEVRYADDRVLVVSKPAGLVTHPATGHTSGTLVNALLGLGVPLSAVGTERPGIVHRLDKDTSGLLLVAKDDDAHRFLKEAMRARRIERTYLALVRGHPASRSGSIDAPVGRHPTRRRSMAVVPGGREAVTHYLVRAEAAGTALLRVTLETGRTHQIRVHLAHLGHPVLGDRVYGGASELSHELGLDRPFLHAAALAFPHPDDARRIDVADPLPPDLTAALAAAGIDPP